MLHSVNQKNHCGLAPVLLFEFLIINHVQNGTLVGTIKHIRKIQS